MKDKLTLWRTSRAQNESELQGPFTLGQKIRQEIFAFIILMIAVTSYAWVPFLLPLGEARFFSYSGETFNFDSHEHILKPLRRGLGVYFFVIWTQAYLFARKYLHRSDKLVLRSIVPTKISLVIIVAAASLMWLNVNKRIDSVSFQKQGGSVVLERKFPFPTVVAENSDITGADLVIAQRNPAALPSMYIRLKLKDGRVFSTQSIRGAFGDTLLDSLIDFDEMLTTHMEVRTVGLHGLNSIYSDRVKKRREERESASPANL